MTWREMWFSEDPDGDCPQGSASLHAIDGGYKSDPTIIRPRGIGFGADLRKPVYRVRAVSRKTTGAPA